MFVVFSVQTLNLLYDAITNEIALPISLLDYLFLVYSDTAYF